MGVESTGNRGGHEEPPNDVCRELNRTFVICQSSSIAIANLSLVEIAHFEDVPDMSVSEASRPEADSSDRPVPFHEPSLELVMPMEVTLDEGTATGITWEIVAGATKRGQDQLVNSNGYTFTYQKSSKNGESRYWLCTKRAAADCKARVIQRGANFTPGSADHTCQADAGAALIAKVKATANREAVAHPHESALKLVRKVNV